jgi:N-methylhydantoinase A
MTSLALGLDVGGTFTDVVMADAATGRLWTTKTPSTPADPSEGFFAGVEKVLDLAAAAPADVATVFHGSTVATNAILEGKGARTGMIVTAGFKYVLEIGRHDIPRKENLYSWVKPKRPVPPRLIMEVPERVLLDGGVERPLDEAACREAARRLRALGVEAVAIVFLHAYANPAHERRAAEIVREEFPAAQVAVSSDVLPVFREYERSMTTVLNAYVQPLVSRYVGRLKGGLEQRGLAAPLFVMKSNGGVFGPAQAGRQAVNMALSGPAAGAIGASFVAGAAGLGNAITIDIGGTSADVSLVRDGRAQMTTEGEVGPFPMAVPIVDIHTVGAGGGSIARVNAQGALTVGPESAGAAPGPACYGRGGTLPTVTDANLVLGRIPPHLLGGEIAIDPGLAEKAIRDHVAGPLGLDLLEAAEGILRIVNNNMVGALKVVSIEKGYDPRDFALVAFGGAGPLHAGELARLLGAPTVLIPLYPGILCALGLLATDLQYDYARTRLQRAPDYDLAGMAATWQALEAEAMADLDREGVLPARRRLLRYADLRYAKQGFELTVEAPAGAVDAAAAAAMVEAFHRLHERLYTFADRAMPVEIVNLRLRAVGAMDKVALPRIADAGGAPAEPAATRRVYFRDRGFVAAPVFRRADLKAGQRIAGPAIVDQLDTTTVVFPGQRAEVDDFGNLVVRLQP